MDRHKELSALNPRYSLIIISFKRDDVLKENLEYLSGMVGHRDDCELVLIDNNEDSTDRAPYLESFRKALYYKPGKNRGVSGGRNDGISRAKGAILIFIDDDAFIQPADFPDLVGQAFEADPRLGAIAFKSINFYTGKIEPAEFPHTDKRRDPNKRFLTFRFIGVGHALRSSAIAEVGLYVDDFFFAAEEFDLCWRLIKHQFKILYLPDIWVRHKHDPGGRMSGKHVVEQMLLNKLRLGYMHLPSRYFLLNAALWSGFAIKLSHGRASLPRVWLRFFGWWRQNRAKRVPMKSAAVAYIRECGGVIWR
jgi:GT2 family glycosyltransferase